MRGVAGNFDAHCLFADRWRDDFLDHHRSSERSRLHADIWTDDCVYWLMTFLVAWGNFITSAVDSTVKNVLKVDPTKIYDDYQKALQMQKAAEGEKSWWEKAFEWRSSLLEAILTGIFFFFGWIAGALVWWAYLLQTVILFIGYALSPIFIGFLAFQTLHEVGKRYFLNLVGVMMWPLAGVWQG
jgi:hypothetical protein